MIGRLLRGLSWLVTNFCVATVLAETIMVLYAVSAWHVDGGRLARALAVAQGIEATAMKTDLQKHPEEPSREQASYDQVLEARAIKARNIELREQALHNGLEQLRFDQGKLAEDNLALQRTKDAFTQDVAATQKRATDNGWEENRRVLMTAKPKQAKELIQQMLEKNEIDDVVALLEPMSDTRRAKIVAEFKTPEDVKKIDDILRRIRHGDPITGATAKAQQQLGAAGLASPQGNP